ncbi:MAG: hypothetical protein V5A25_09295 [Halovenus sp.]
MVVDVAVAGRRCTDHWKGANGVRGEDDNENERPGEGRDAGEDLGKRKREPPHPFVSSGTEKRGSGGQEPLLVNRKFYVNPN